MVNLTPPPASIRDREVYDYLYQLQEYLGIAMNTGYGIGGKTTVTYTEDGEMLTGDGTSMNDSKKEAEQDEEYQALKAMVIKTANEVWNGQAGGEIQSVTPLFYLSTSAEETEGGAWSEEYPTWRTGTFIWSKMRVIYGIDESISDTTPICLAQEAQSGKVTWRIKFEFLLSQSNVELTEEEIASDEWSLTPQQPDIDQFLWVRQINYLWPEDDVEHATEEESEIIKDDPACLSAQIADVLEGIDSILLRLGDNEQRISDLHGEMTSNYLAVSDFGAYMEEKLNSIAWDDEGIQQQFKFYTQLKSSIEEVGSYITNQQGYIRSGVIGYDEFNEAIIGIAIGSELTVERTDDDGNDVIAQENFRATYTAEKLSFWNGTIELAYMDGSKVHITEAEVEKLSIGNWDVSDEGEKGLTFRYIG
ncbi:MAG: hypothetical protein KBS74_02180 [Clostridiales bacterium]|nr:hypothetical protein [Candidatus Cacconaster stercorequi]